MVQIEFDKERKGWVMFKSKSEITKGKHIVVYECCGFCGKELQPIFYVDMDYRKGYCKDCAKNPEILHATFNRPEFNMQRIIEVKRDGEGE